MRDVGGRGVVERVEAEQTMGLWARVGPGVRRRGGWRAPLLCEIPIIPLRVNPQPRRPLDAGAFLRVPWLVWDGKVHMPSLDILDMLDGVFLVERIEDVGVVRQASQRADERREARHRVGVLGGVDGVNGDILRRVVRDAEGGRVEVGEVGADAAEHGLVERE